MNVQAIFHKPESSYCFAHGSSVTLRLRIAQGENVSRISVLYNTKYDIAKKQYSQEMSLRLSDGSFDYYQTTLKLDDLRLAYVFLIEYDGKCGYFCEDGLLDSYDFNFAYFNSFQYAYINSADITQNVSWLNNAVFYQIFVERFCNSGEGDKSYVNSKWSAKPTPKAFYGGDIKGIISKLDYIKDLGVNTLYLTPVFSSKSNHKYDIFDYYTIDRMFGTNDDFKQLVDACHALGIRVVLDGVFNHVSEQLAQFQDVLKNGSKSPYFDWFIIDGKRINNAKSNYCCFAECKYMPKLNTSNKVVQGFVVDIATHWISKYDIDGWRLDVSDEVSHDMWRVLRKAVKNAKSDAVLIGENWHNSESFLGGEQFDSIMNYAFTKQMMDYFCHKIPARTVANRLNSQLMRYSDITNNMMFNLLDSHDTHRFLSLVNEDTNKLLCAFAIMAFMQGCCCVYYGSEVLVTGGYDPDCRKGFPWSSLEKADIVEFREKVKRLLALKSQPSLIGGEISVYEENGGLVIERRCESQRLVLKTNLNGIGGDDSCAISEKLFNIYGRLV